MQLTPVNRVKNVHESIGFVSKMCYEVHYEKCIRSLPSSGLDGGGEGGMV